MMGVGVVVVVVEEGEGEVLSFLCGGSSAA